MSKDTEAKLIYVRNAKGGVGAYVLCAPYTVAVNKTEHVLYQQLLPAEDVGFSLAMLMMKYPCPDELKRVAA